MEEESTKGMACSGKTILGAKEEDPKAKLHSQVKNSDK
jgi:hypothetical protein